MDKKHKAYVIIRFDRRSIRNTMIVGVYSSMDDVFHQMMLCQDQAQSDRYEFIIDEFEVNDYYRSDIPLEEFRQERLDAYEGWTGRRRRRRKKTT